MTNKQNGVGISEIANEGVKRSDKGETWLCPLCSAARVAYGKSCKAWPECGQVLTVNGRYYMRLAGKVDE